MEIKSFKIKIDDLGNYQFIDKRDEEAFKRTLSFLFKNKGIEKLELSINTIDEKSTEKQQNLFRILCRKISQESGGQYSYEIVSSAFLSYIGFNYIEEVPKESFNELITYSVHFASELYNINVRINPDNNHVEIL